MSTEPKSPASCPFCRLRIEAEEVRNYQILKGWAAGCDTEGCPGELDDRRVFPKKSEAIEAAANRRPATPAPESPAPALDLDGIEKELRTKSTGPIRRSALIQQLIAEVRRLRSSPAQGSDIGTAPEVGTGSETSPDAGASREAAGLDVCRLLDGFQKQYEANTHGCKMPGNDFYSGQLMTLVQEARRALSLPSVAKPADVSEAEHSSPSQPPEPLDGARLVEVLDTTFSILEEAPELNPSNYDHDEVCKLNAKMVEAFLYLQSQRAALAQAPTRTRKGE